MMLSRKKSMLLVAVSALVFLVGYLTLKQTERLLTEAFESKLVLISNQSPYQISYEGLDISILKQSFWLADVMVLPDSLPRDGKSLQPHMAIASITAHDFEILPLLFNRHLNIGEIEMNNLEMVYSTRKGNGQKQKKSPNTKKKEKSPLKKLTVESIGISDYLITELSTNLKDSLSTLQGENFSINGVAFERTPKKRQLSLNPSKLTLHASNLFGKLGNTELMLSNFQFNTENSFARFDSLQIGSPYSSRQIAKHQKYNKPVNSAKIPVLECFGIQTDSLLKHGNFVADSLLLDRAHFTIIKNIAKPWDTNAVIPLPQELLRNKKQNIAIERVHIKDAKTQYFEVTKTDEIEIPIDQLQVTIKNLGQQTVEIRNQEEQSMEVAIQGRFFYDFPVEARFLFPKPMQSDLFQFEGSTGPFHFETFNPIMVPTSNIKFESGYVQRINFNGTGNADRASGEFVMIYDDLTTTVLKRKGHKKNKAFSWLANATVRKQNPKNGRIKVARMEHQRVVYKGFGNYMFKTIETGLTNSVYPFGNRKKYK
ncbi:MAG: hypothetical protein AAF969_12615 [Bacteroidota bacterium]